ncbi:MAG: Na/Pi cotransporter family protein [Bacteroidales bacterium]|jgi:phosphate:Na+ symporter|nr:Na/Pi cotransporter family protein [Bacteroidales bacterium]
MTTSALIMLIVQVIGALALFLFGMKYMSEALQRLAGPSLRSVLSSFTSNRFKAVLTGTFVTSLIQSSSATTVMVVSFVNAGILNLSNAIGVIMGANIGTTVTAWIITLFGIKVDIAVYSIPIIGLGFICMMLRSKKVQHIGEFLLGFGLLFLGLTFLKDSLSDLDLANNPQFVAFIQQFIGAGENTIAFPTILLFVLIGTLLTLILQSSSATMALTLVLCSQGVIPFEIAVAIVLGENIGTTITANLAAIIGNTTAKRAARSHFIFNVIGVCWVLAVFHPFVNMIDALTIKMDGVSAYASALAVPTALSLFHSFFNIINTSLLVGFIPQIEKTTNFLVKKNTQDEEIFKLENFGTNFMKTGEMNVEIAKKEIIVFSKRMIRMYEFLPVLLNDTKPNSKEYEELLRRIQRYEELSDRMEIEIANYITTMTNDGLSDETNLRVRGMLRIVDNLESIGDQNFQLAKTIENKNTLKIKFNPECQKNIDKMFTLVHEALDIMHNNLEIPYRTVEPERAEEAENAINAFRDKIKQQHFIDINNNVYDYQTGIIYSGICAILEKTGDHIINITQALVNAKLHQDEDII